MRAFFAFLGLCVTALVLMGQVVVNPPTPPLTSTQFDQTFGSTRGSILERGASGWGSVVPGTSGLPWTSNGPGADPAYQTLTNAALASMAAGTVKCEPGTGAGAPQDCTYSTAGLPQSVKIFGALGNSNGTHLNGNDDTTAITNALSATNDNGIYFPCGIYRITSNISLNTSSSSKSYRIFGDGACSKLYLDTTVAANMFTFSNVTCCCVGCITFKGVNFIAPNTVTGSQAVVLTNEEMMLFEGNFATGWAALINLTTSYAPRIVGNTIQTMPGGLFAPTANGDQTFNNLIFWRNRLAALGITNGVSAVNLNCNGATQLSILGNDLEVSEAGFQFQNCNSVVLEGNYMDVNTIYHIQFQGTNVGFSIRGNWFGQQAGQTWTNITKSIWGANTFATVNGVGFGSTALGTIIEPTNIVAGAGHLNGLPTPTLSGCGTGSPTVVGTRFRGAVTEGTTATGCTVTFELAYDVIPICVVSPSTLSVGTVTLSGTSISAFSVVNSSNTGGIFTYSCEETTQ